MTQPTIQKRFKRGSADAGRYFWYMADFIGFTEEDANTIRETRFIIEKYIPQIVADFYTQLFRFPSTRRKFENKDGTIDQSGLQLRMQHQATFWRRAASGVYDDDFARYVDYVGRAHTSQGADPKIYIAERYVIGMVGFVQQKITVALESELKEIDPVLMGRGMKAWNALLMVILELLARPYNSNPSEEAFDQSKAVDEDAVHQLAVETYERSLGIARSIIRQEVLVGKVDEIPDGARKIVQVDDLSIGVFHHKGRWYALHNSCLHRGGPVCEGDLSGDTIKCPWHGYEYDVTSGELYLDRNAKLPMYRVEIRGDDVYLHIPRLVREPLTINLDPIQENGVQKTAGSTSILQENEFLIDQLAPGEIKQLYVDGESVVVANVDGNFLATHSECTHAGGPLHEGHLNGYDIVCPWHDSCFDMRSGNVTCGPAKIGIRPYRVQVEGEKGIVTKMSE